MTPTSTTPNGQTQEYSTDTLLTIAAAIRQFIVDQGQATKREIRAHTAGLGYPTEAYQKALTLLHDTMTITTEITNDDGTKAYRLKREGGDQIDLHLLYDSIADAQKPKRPVERFGDWFNVTGRLTLFAPALSGRPVLGETSQLSFIHDHLGRCVLLRTYFQQMLITAASKPSAPDIGNARFKIEFDTIFMPPSTITPFLKPVPPARPGGSGQGITNTECLPPGTVIPFHAVVPGSHCSREQFEELMMIAGRWVGFSPAGAHDGWGVFEVDIDPPTT